MKVTAVPASTVKRLLVPLSEPALLAALMVKLPVSVMVTLWPLSTPAVKAVVVPLPALSVPVEVISTVPVKSVTVLP